MPPQAVAAEAHGVVEAVAYLGVLMPRRTAAAEVAVVLVVVLAMEDPVIVGLCGMNKEIVNG
ncbi:MAG: hypothetical protein DRJ03_07505 [Chloroflexi bacterium]|nr:MAG: hypothetical protein DRJ03_07505 [Chloroflexota bacterium]